MTKYHLSPTTGRKEICHATVKPCKFQHFTVGSPSEQMEEAVKAGDLNAFLEAKTAEVTNEPDVETILASFPAGSTVEYDPEYGEEEYWEGVRSKCQTIAVNGREVAITPEGKSSFQCLSCSESLSHEESEQLLASKTQQIEGSCGHVHHEGLTGVSLQRSQVPLLLAENVHKTRWYHTSRFPDWDSKISSPDEDTPFIHVGSIDAALDRAHAVNKNHEDVYLYEIELVETAEVSDAFLDDDPHGEDLPTLGEDYSHDESEGTLKTRGVVRYLNHYEDAGSVSLIADPRCLRVLSKQRLY